MYTQSKDETVFFCLALTLCIKASTYAYALQGRRLPATPRRGLYIKDGRKIYESIYNLR